MNHILRGVKAEIVAHFTDLGNIDEVRDKIADDKVRAVMETSLIWNGNADEELSEALKTGNLSKQLETIGRLIARSESGSVINDIVIRK